MNIPSRIIFTGPPGPRAVGFPLIEDWRGYGGDTSDTGTIQSAFNQAAGDSTTPKLILCPARRYTIEAPITIPPGLNIVGMGRSATIFDVIATVTSVFTTGLIDPVARINISGFCVKANRLVTNAVLDLNFVKDVWISDLWLIDCDFDYIQLGHASTATSSAGVYLSKVQCHRISPTVPDASCTGIHVIRCGDSHYGNDSEIIGVKYGVRGTGAGAINDSKFNRMHIWSALEHGFLTAGYQIDGIDNQLSQLQVDGPFTTAFDFTSAAGQNVLSNSSVNKTTYGGTTDNSDNVVKIHAGASLVATGNTFNAVSSVRFAADFSGDTSRLTARDNIVKNSVYVHGDTDARQNQIIDGAFDYWPQGAGPFVPVFRYTSATWRFATGTGESFTVSREDFTIGQTEVPANPKYFIRCTRTVIGTTFSVLQCYLPGGAARFSGRTLTLHFWGRTSSAAHFHIRMDQTFGTGGSPSDPAATLITAPSPGDDSSTSWQKYTYSFSMPSVSGKTLGSDGNDALRLTFLLNIEDGLVSYDLANVKVELGARPSIFVRDPLETTIERAGYLVRSVPFHLTSNADASVRAGNVVRVGPMVVTPSITLTPASGTGGTVLVARDVNTGEVIVYQGAAHSVDTTATVLLDARQ
jgi:hypothetical protein